MMVGQFTYLALVVGSQSAGDLGRRRGLIEVQGEEVVGIVSAAFDIRRGCTKDTKSNGSADEKTHRSVSLFLFFFSFSGVKCNNGVACQRGERSRDQRTAMNLRQQKETISEEKKYGYTRNEFIG